MVSISTLIDVDAAPSTLVPDLALAVNVYEPSTRVASGCTSIIPLVIFAFVNVV